ncbi:response regulator transcription factor [Streptomyces sp. ISL-1]|uniref:response regulator transcription factor n=1 Tax=Streptomyces sp. ISL-1 TaxID=2817657 RepID=UPI0027E52769|nr:response regulator transcription factor [Streptomyces sp. ISL-1]
MLLLRRAESTAEASRILLAGASGCFPLDLPEDRIIRAVSLAAAGGSVFLPAPPPARIHPASLAGHAAEPSPQHCDLTEREREVLVQLGRGLSNAEIERELALAEATVKKHLTQAMRKIGQSDRLRPRCTHTATGWRAESTGVGRAPLGGCPPHACPATDAADGTVGYPARDTAPPAGACPACGPRRTTFGAVALTVGRRCRRPSGLLGGSPRCLALSH